MTPVSISTIKEKLTLYKDGIPAEKIELILLEENGFTLISKKDLYKVGDKVIYIQPDYCVSDISLFESFLRPLNKDGVPDESKSMLGKIGGQPRRIRAKKFNFNIGDGEPVYSNGILLSIKEVADYLSIKNNKQKDDGIFLNLILNGGSKEYGEFNLTNELGITKAEEPDSPGMNIGVCKPFPVFLYKADEENINNLWNKISYPIILAGTVKTDGSSITIGRKDDFNFICSRNQLKPLTIKTKIGVRKKNFWDYIKFWKKTNLDIFQEKENNDDFVKYGKPYLDILSEYKSLGNIVLRGELNGAHLKGSGNKNNPSRSLKPNIKFFGVDYFNKNSQTFIKSNYDFFHSVSTLLNLDTCEEVFVKTFNSKEEIISECNNYFKSNMVEGIVLRSLDSKFSAKFMNLEYDSKK